MLSAALLPITIDYSLVATYLCTNKWTMSHYVHWHTQRVCPPVFCHRIGHPQTHSGATIGHCQWQTSAQNYSAHDELSNYNNTLTVSPIIPSVMLSGGGMSSWIPIPFSCRVILVAIAEHFCWLITMSVALLEWSQQQAGGDSVYIQVERTSKNVPIALVL